MTETDLFQRLRNLDDTWRVGYAEAGLICKTVEDNLLWRDHVGCSSFSAWVRLACPFGYSTAFSAMRAVRELSDVSARDLSHISASNIQTMVQLSSAVRTLPEVIQAAKEKRADDFIEHIKEHHPTQHIESRKTLRFVASESEAQEIEEAITLAMERGAMNRTEALLVICIDYRAAAILEEWRS